jgi:hypothetical protein
MLPVLFSMCVRCLELAWLLLWASYTTNYFVFKCQECDNRMASNNLDTNNDKKKKTTTDEEIRKRK